MFLTLLLPVSYFFGFYEALGITPGSVVLVKNKKKSARNMLMT